MAILWIAIHLQSLLFDFFKCYDLYMYQKIASMFGVLYDFFMVMSIFAISIYHTGATEALHSSASTAAAMRYIPNLERIQEDKTFFDDQLSDSFGLSSKYYTSDEEEINLLIPNVSKCNKNKDQKEMVKEIPIDSLMIVAASESERDKDCFLNCFAFLKRVFSKKDSDEYLAMDGSISSHLYLQESIFN